MPNKQKIVTFVILVLLDIYSFFAPAVSYTNIFYKEFIGSNDEFP